MDQSLSRAQVVDLLRYRQERTASEGAIPRPRLASVNPFKPLSARQVEHRARMLTHLREVKSQKSEVKSTESPFVVPHAWAQTFDF
jgi:hypothetical protein